MFDFRRLSEHNKMMFFASFPLVSCSDMTRACLSGECRGWRLAGR